MINNRVNFLFRSDCGLCGGKDSEVLVNVSYLDPKVWDFVKSYYRSFKPKDFFGARYEIRKCRQCGFMWQSYVLNKQSLYDLYEKQINEVESRQKKSAANPEHLRFLAAEVAAVRSLVGRSGQKEVRVLDFGMGWGQWCLMAGAFGYRVYGTELSGSRKKHVRSMGGWK